MNTFIRLILFPIALIITLLWYTCSDEPTKPPPNNGIDSTTHNWRFEIDTLGGYNSGAHDVVAFSENDTWISGNFYVYTNPNDPGERTLYNVAHFDGKTWKLMQVGSPVFDGILLYALNPQFMVLSAYGFHFYNGYSWRMITVKDYSIFQGEYGMWASKPTEVHMVGNKGSWIIWDGDVDGGNFRRIPTPTNIDLKDIYGDGDVIYACGITPNFDRSIVLKYENGKVTTIDSANPQKLFQIFSLWYSAKENVLAYAGARQKIFHKVWKEADSLGNVIPYCEIVRGSAPNNVWWGGSFLTLLHYNGSTWKLFKLPSQTGILTNISVHDNFLIATGFDDAAIIVRGYKQ